VFICIQLTCYKHSCYTRSHHHGAVMFISDSSNSCCGLYPIHHRMMFGAVRRNVNWCQCILLAAEYGNCGLGCAGLCRLGMCMLGMCMLGMCHKLRYYLQTLWSGAPSFLHFGGIRDQWHYCYGDMMMLLSYEHYNRGLPAQDAFCFKERLWCWLPQRHLVLAPFCMPWQGQ
jgi:hypothetical protein